MDPLFFNSCVECGVVLRKTNEPFNVLPCGHFLCYSCCYFYGITNNCPSCSNNQFHESAINKIDENMTSKQPWISSEYEDEIYFIPSKNEMFPNYYIRINKEHNAENNSRALDEAELIKKIEKLKMTEENNEMMDSEH